MLMGAFRILLSSNSSQWRDGLAAAFAASGRFEVAGSVDLDQMIQTAEQLQPEVVLWELKEDLLYMLTELKACCPFTVTVVMVGNPNRFNLLELVRTGVMGCLPLRLLPQQIVSAVELVVGAGLLCLPRPDLKTSLGSDTGESKGTVSILSRREEEVLAMLANKLSTQEIAASLYLSESTVKTHLRNIFRKLGVRNRTEAVAAAYQLGLVKNGNMTMG